MSRGANEGAPDPAPGARVPADPTPVLIGLMSGTSLDGVSAAVVRFAGDHAAELLAFRQVPFTDAQRNRLAGALRGATPDEYCRLNFDLGHWLADAAIAALAEAGVPREEVAAIASHGQTVWHAPGHSTWQFGEPAVIAERTGIDVISDFRVRDVAAGGQGAPLVPIADALLFASPTSWRALQNLGGIGNVTVVPPFGERSAVRAFDTGPGMVVIDAVTRSVSPGSRYDDGGRLARAGTAIEPAVRDALAHPYFEQSPPKSTGRELFSAEWIEQFMASCRRHAPESTPADLVATAVRLTAASIGDAFRRFVPEPVSEVLLSGGGAENPVLVEAIASELAPATVRRFSDEYFDGEAKEAVAFALLGRLFLQRRAGNVVSVTGARGPRLLGKLTPAANPPRA